MNWRKTAFISGCLLLFITMVLALLAVWWSAGPTQDHLAGTAAVIGVTGFTLTLIGGIMSIDT